MFSRHRVIFSLLAAGLLGIYGSWSHRTRPDSATTEDRTASPSFKSAATSVAAESERGVRVSPDRVEDRWHRRWRELRALADEALLDKEMEALLEELAAIDPMRALSLAEAEPDPERCLGFFQAALRGWGGANPGAAAAWALSQTVMDQGQAMASVFHGAARDPENALRLNAQLSEQEPERAQDYGSYLVAAFTRAGEFSQAAAFAAESAPEVRVDWLNAAYSRWAGDQPQAALEHLGKLSNREIRQMAFDAAVSHWAQNKPREVAEYALTLSDGREREFALNAALRAWSSADAVEAATWMGRFEPSPHLDFGAAMIASQPEAMRHPQIATSWAESITDPRLRVAILASVVNEWALTDPVAARRYAEFSPRIWAEDRAGVLFAFEPDFHPISLLP